ncbi:MAG: SurA N-terminal domain-containing protein [Akkermansiaceae bacterium]|nr:SurA N-terminal domain-containing protein [Akkermansiaceae bacterium]
MISMRILPALLAGILLCITGIQESSAEPMEINGIAAKVNGRVITKNEVSFMLAPIYRQLRAQYPRQGEEFKTKLMEARDKILDELIEREIIIDEYKQLGATIPDQVVENEIKRQINRLYNGDKEKFNEELRKSRMTMNGYRQMQKEKMIVQAMRSAQFDDAAPPLPNEIQNEYHSIKQELRDTSADRITFYKIFIPANDPLNPNSTRESQLALAEDLVKDIKEGKDMAKLAKTHSKDAFAEQGGLQEDVPRMDLSAEFAAIIFDANEGDVIGPLSDETGFTIVKPVEIKLGPVPPLSEIRDIVEERVRTKKTSKQYEDWIQKRSERAMIEIKI